MTQGNLIVAESCRILVVDDEVDLCNMLSDYLKVTYKYVDSAYSLSEAVAMILDNSYDVVITDLRLGDGFGTEILKYCKKQDPFIEVIVITGYGTLESASEIVNLGAASFLNKPLKLTEFGYQVERATNTRLFHLKSLALMSSESNQDHLNHITSLYHFASRLMLTLNVSELMRIILRELNLKLPTSYVVAGVSYLSYKEVFAMAKTGILSKPIVEKGLIKNWSEECHPFKIDELEKDSIELEIFANGSDDDIAVNEINNVKTLPLSVLGDRFGFISLYLDQDDVLTKDKMQFFYVLTSLISSAVQHCYLNAQASKQAKTDGLTGIANHRLFQEMADREIARANRAGGEFSIVLLDIDDFKRVNDTFGHLVGDAVLIDLTKRVLSLTRKSDVLARYGGEEFILILSDTDSNGAEIFAERVRKIIADKPFNSSKIDIPYTVSIGFSTYNKKLGIKKGELIDAADKALYRAKESGKNRVIRGSL